MAREKYLEKANNFARLSSYCIKAYSVSTTYSTWTCAKTTYDLSTKGGAILDFCMIIS